MSFEFKEPEKKKVDESWKDRIDAEKQKGEKPQPQKGAREEKPREEPPEPDMAAEGVPAEGGQGDFQAFISSLAMQGLMMLGELPNPATGKKELELEQAKYIIDTLIMVKGKTKGNLTKAEAKILEQALYELQTRFVAKSTG